MGPDSPLLSRHASPDAHNHMIDTGGRRAERIWEPANPLADSIKKEMMEACQTSEFEVCGLVSSTGEIFYLANDHTYPRTNFLVTNDVMKIVLANMIQDGHMPIGIFHTHPNSHPWPTPRDVVGWPNPDLGWRYWLATRTDVTEWMLV